VFLEVLENLLVDGILPAVGGLLPAAAGHGFLQRSRPKGPGKIDIHRRPCYFIAGRGM